MKNGFEEYLVGKEGLMDEKQNGMVGRFNEYDEGFSDGMRWGGHVVRKSA